jgi:hypothetical protein
VGESHASHDHERNETPPARASAGLTARHLEAEGVTAARQLGGNYYRFLVARQSGGIRSDQEVPVILLKLRLILSIQPDLRRCAANFTRFVTAPFPQTY